MSLTDIYNSEVVYCEYVEREGSWSGKDGKGFHVGVRVTTKNGKQWLVHHVPNQKPILTDSANMSFKWKVNYVIQVNGRKTIGGIMQAAGDSIWSIYPNNCKKCNEKVQHYLEN